MQRHNFQEAVEESKQSQAANTNGFDEPKNKSKQYSLTNPQTRQCESTLKAEKDDAPQ